MEQSESIHILYMEDDPGLARLVQKRMRRAGYRVDTANDGKTGLKMYRAGRYDVIAVDQQMPGYSGLEVIKILASRGPLPPIVMITGQGDELLAVEAIKIGAGDYVVKDVDGKYFETLPGVIERLLERQRLIEDKKATEKELKIYRDHLEELVEDRTAALHQEIEERKRTELELHRAKEAALAALQTAEAAQKAAEAAQKAAEAANKLKSEFLANMSHDIRTPLNAVLGFAEILKEKLGDVPQYQSYLDRIMAGGRTLLHLIDEILDLSRIEAGQVEVRAEAVNIRMVLTEMQHMFMLKAEKKGIRLTTHISEDTPSTVMVDGKHLRQILVNLVGNAVKFTEKGSVTLRVKTLETGNSKREEQHSASREHASRFPVSSVQFHIEDTGIGIPEDDLARMFEPFQQLDPRGPGGSGLGLAITKRLVALMQGTIAVESAVDEGTRFSVVLPVGASAARAEKVRARKYGKQICFRGATILLVEDNAANREVIRAYTATCDLRLIEAENGQEALHMLTPGSAPGGAGILPALRPDLILMDIRMPVMGGYEATQRLKADPELRTIPVVALTAHAVKEQVEQYRNLYEAYLTKPISKHDLIAALADFLPHTQTSPEGVDLGKNSPPGPLSCEERGSKSDGGVLEELQEYAARTGTFPRALLDTLRADLLPRHEDAYKLMSVDEIMAFAESVMTVGETFAMAPLKHYGEELLYFTNLFDVVSMKRLLGQFAEIAAIINSDLTKEN